ncbi:hypothetical protein F4814DRAFT_411374 [Daldinia grandis]|nr:hypothetical protein F4814DRAFT_411374 [Daldinia grandis]
MVATFRVLSFAAFWHASAALLVADGSPCETKCGNVLGSTTDDMIVCEDSAYSVTSPGQVYGACIGCESRSSFATPNGAQNKSDLQYMLYNMRYAVNVCLFDAGTSPCVTSFACGDIKQAIKYGNLTSSGSIYGYCDKWTDYNLDKCHSCLASSSDSNYLSNFISILDGACRLRLEPPATLPLQGNIFSTDAVNVTDPTPTATFSPPGLKGPLDSGAIAGIAVGSLAVLLIIVGCGIVVNGKRRRKAYLRRREQATKNLPPSQGGGEMFETPISQKPLRGWQDSPISASTQTAFTPYFSPYSSQYNSPISGVEGHNMAWPTEKSHNIGIAISPDREVYSPWSDKKGKEKVISVGDDGYELQEGVNSTGGYENMIQPSHAYNPPLLNHPGYGRRSTGSQESPRE